ncbi:MAG: hypothetical protein J6Y37_12800, partial [Paludibacteraceae bacterium]|nr:hypothetical protein [Paludibacteraceae bacterium]
MRCQIAQTHLLIFLILGIGALEEEDLGITFVSQYMRADTIQEPTVVRNNYCATREILQTLLQGTKRIHINIIGRLIEQKDIRLRLERLCQMQTVSLTTGQDAALLL